MASDPTAHPAADRAPNGAKAGVAPGAKADSARDIPAGAPVRLNLTSDTATLAPTRKAVEKLAADVGFEEESVAHIGLCVNEAMANVIEHAYSGALDQPLEVAAWFEASAGELVVRIRDWGSGVVPPEVSPVADEPLTPGGLGLKCLRTMMHRVEYHPQADGMVLVMARRKGPAPRSEPT
jgi:anti-sigma regulatory factor (Ser/Thr protein kinase)